MYSRQRKLLLKIIDELEMKVIDFKNVPTHEASKLRNIVNRLDVCQHLLASLDILHRESEDFYV